MLKTFLPIILILAVTGYAAYPDIAPKFATVPARVYQVSLSAVMITGGQDAVNSNITLLSEATLSSTVAQMMHTQPQSLTFLRITSSQGIVYAAVNWTPSQSGAQQITFYHLVIPVSSPHDSATFYYHDYAGVETSLGTF